MKKLILALAVIFVFTLSAVASGGWSHGQYSPGQYSASVTTPSVTHVQQVFQAFNYTDGSGTHWGEVVNDGPLGNYNAAAGPQQSYQGDVGGGTYYIYQVVLVSGYSVTVLTW